MTSPPPDANEPSLIVMLGGLGDDGLEGLMRRALEASALDVLEAAVESDSYSDVVLVADRAPSERLPDGVRLTLDNTAEPFHFGKRLAETVADSGCGRFVYVGAGAAPLLGAEDLSQLAARLEPGGPLCVTNNFYSADLFAVRPAGLLRRIDPWPPADNGVPRALKEQLDVEIDELPRTTATQLNLDSPIDLVAIGLAGAGGPRLRALIAQWAPESERVASAARVLTDRRGEVMIAGRVSSRAWRYLESETACRVRLLSEERGMTAAGRDADLTARSMLGQLVEAVGPERCFQELIPQLCDAAFIDIRPVLAHLGWQPSRADRFAADLGLADQIEDAGLRAFVAAAAASPIPVVLGGHSLVVGALMLLNDWVWDEHDRLLAEESRS